MNKVKVRCASCGKSFKTPSLKKTLCPTCEADQKRARHQQPVSSEKPASTSSSISTLDVRAALRAAQDNQGQFDAYKSTPTTELPTPEAQRREKAGKHPQRMHEGAKARPPKPAREKLAPAQQKPFEPTPDQIQHIKQRYVELAVPEFDGIRHQIAQELGIPLQAVKRVVKEVRLEQAIPSWWEQNTLPLDPEKVQKIRELYTPMLPQPAIGVHKHIATQLQLKNMYVYQAIGQIREELGMPRYVLHETEVSATRQ